MKEVRRAGHTPDEWEEWMNWDLTPQSKPCDGGAHEPSQTSPDGTCQLPSPVASTTSRAPFEHCNKRKISSDSQDVKPSSKRQSVEQLPVQNKSHSIVEKRYRNNLNQKITELGDCLPTLRDNGKTQADSEGPSPTLKHNKATVLSEAITYIRYLEQRNAYLQETKTAFQERPRNFPLQELALGANAEVKEEIPGAKAGSSSEFPNTELDPEASSKSVQGMIEVPEEWRKLRRGELQPYDLGQEDSGGETEKEATIDTKMRGGKYAGRVMLGSLAGLMVMNGLGIDRKDTSDERVLFSFPLLRRLPIQQDMVSTPHFPLFGGPPSSLPRLQVLEPLLKAFLIFSFFGLMLFTYLFNSRPPPRKDRSFLTPQPAPSLASPLYVRQRAFLTAIQTIWVPRHHVLPEMLALNLETAAYLIRQLLGWHTYSWLTGRSEDEEIARVRAWDIAIDAQLSGGDPEISKSRLVLSLWAAGTLPSSPARFMLKALHIRILFWQPSRIPWLTDLLHKAAEKLARWQWNKAYRMQQKLESSTLKSDIEPLTHHLQCLLQCLSNEVMTDPIIHRAHNLAWNRSISDRDSSEIAIDDTAMRGPLDALAAWSSNAILISALTTALGASHPGEDAKSFNAIDVAFDLAPTGSIGKAKALAAKAVLCNPSLCKMYARQLVDVLEPSNLCGTDSSVEVSWKLPVLLSELPTSDGADIAACLQYVSLVQNDRGIQYWNSRPDYEIVNRLYDLKGIARNMGLLGWMAIHRIVVKSRSQVTPVFESQQAFNAATCNLLQWLSLSKALDEQMRTQIARSFNVASDYQTRKRSCSVASNDTGYASMADEDDVDCEHG